MSRPFRSCTFGLPVLAALLLGMLLAGPTAAQALPTGATAKVRPGDAVALKIWNEPEMSDTFAISASGEVVLPRLGDVRVTDLGVVELQDSLRRAFSVYLRNPSVEVTVLRRVSVQGEVREPDLYMVDLTMTLRDVIARAGGVSSEGDPGRIFVVRGGERIRFGKGDQARFTAADLLSGDQVVVGQKSWLSRNALAATGTLLGVAAFVVPMIRDALKDE
ncbi:MAG TPA: polysaccharide biosynthesis/export family protein [Longimicrobiaceae bacterium]